MSRAGGRRIVAWVDEFGTRRRRLAMLGGLTALAVWTIANVVFPYHSVNHDEAVYLQQTAMLLDGQLFLQPPVADAFRPWFFVESPRGLYSKYSPVTAAMYAAGELLGGYRIALPLIAAGCVLALQRVIAMAFDERTGYVGALVLLASPLFLVDASVFLPYVPTTFLNLSFAAAYFHADRTGDSRWAALAGLAIGLAFFARPYTAVLFALPFVVHALWTMRSLDASPIRRQVLTAIGGLAGVAAALGYNAVVTGDPFLFPYQAFAPLDGLGFGRRELLGYAVEYTIGLALRANAEALWLFATRWLAAGALGTILAVIGFVVAVRRGLDARQATLAGLAVTVPVGNLYFWGTLNTLGDLSEAGDGLGHYVGPYYHVDLLVPAATFGAVGLLAVVGWIDRQARSRLDWRRDRGRVFAGVLLVAVLGGAVAVAAAGPLADNAAVTERYESAYEPFDDESLADRPLDDAVVLLPTPHGDWLNHPFQVLRNDPGYDDGPVYALRERQFAVLDAFPDRTAYRYTYHGAWNPRVPPPVEAHLQRVRDVRASTVVANISASVPDSGETLLVTLSADGGSDFTGVTLNGDDVDGTLTLRNGSAVLSIGPNATARVPVGDRDAVVVRAAVDTGFGTGPTYRLELPVNRTGGAIRALTPVLEVCRDESLCGGEAGYVPGMYGDDVTFDATVRASPRQTSAASG